MFCLNCGNARVCLYVCCSTKKFYLFCFHTFSSCSLTCVVGGGGEFVSLCVFVVGGNMLKNVVVAVVTLLITLTLRFLLCYVYV